MEDWKTAAVCHLREYNDICRAKEQVETALATLSPEDRTILQMIDICKSKGNVATLCEVLGCETTTIYRRRDRALRLFYYALYGE